MALFLVVVSIEVALIESAVPNWKQEERKKKVGKQICDFLCIWILAFFLARPMFLLPAIEGRWPFVDFPPVGQENSGDIFISGAGDDDNTWLLWWWLYSSWSEKRELYIFFGEREICLQTWCRHVCFSYCNMMALSVNPTFWKHNITYMYIYNMNTPAQKLHTFLAKRAQIDYLCYRSLGICLDNISQPRLQRNIAQQYASPKHFSPIPKPFLISDIAPGKTSQLVTHKPSLRIE